MRASLLLSFTALLLVPASASASFATFGSALDRPADRTESEQRDIAYWQTQLSGGRPTTAPTDGQIKKVEIRGYARTTVPPGDPNQPGSPVFFLQALSPEGPNVRARISSQPFYLPGSTTGTPNTITAYAPENFCVKQGESLSMTGVGGWDGGGPGQTPYSDGTPFQTFATAESSTVRYFTANDGLRNGSLFAPRPGETADAVVDVPRTELLMRLTIATGDDRSYECGGPNTYRPADPVPTPGRSGAEKVVSPAARLPGGARGSIDRRGRAYIGLYCPKVRACAGALVLSAGRTPLGVAKYAIPMGKTQSVRFKLSRKGLAFVKKRRYRITAVVTAVTDGAGTQTGRIRLKKRGA